MKVQDIAVSQIVDSKNYRAEVALDADFLASIKEHGILEPLLITPGAKANVYDLVAGGRRFAAAKKLKLPKVPCSIVGKLTEAERLAIGLVENTQRLPTTPVEDAAAIAKLYAEGWTSQAIAKKLGRQPHYVEMVAGVDRLRAETKQRIKNGDLPLYTATRLARLRLTAEQEALAVKALAGTADYAPRSKGAVVEWINANLTRHLSNAHFSLTKAYPEVKGAVPCLKCPKRSGVQTVLFSDEPSKDVCLDSACFRAKCAAHAETIRATEPEKMVAVKFDATGHVTDPKYVDCDELAPAQGKTWEKVLKPGAKDVRYAVAPDGTLRRLAPRPQRQPSEAPPPKAALGPAGDASAATEEQALPPPKVAKEDQQKAMRRVRKEALEMLDKTLADVEFAPKLLSWYLRQHAPTLPRPALISFLEVEGRAEEKELRTMTLDQLQELALEVVDRIRKSGLADGVFAMLLELEAHEHLVRVSPAEPEVPAFIVALHKVVSAG